MKPLSFLLLLMLATVVVPSQTPIGPPPPPRFRIVIYDHGKPIHDVVGVGNLHVSDPTSPLHYIAWKDEDGWWWEVAYGPGLVYKIKKLP